MNTRLQDRMLRTIQTAGRIRAAAIIRSWDRYGDERRHAVQALINTGQVRLTWNEYGDSYLEATR